MTEAKGEAMRRAVGVAVVTGLCLVGAGPAWAVFPGQNGRIIYARSTYDTGAYSVRTILPSGHGDRVIAHEGFGFSWSPNGERIAFAAGAGPDIYTMRADGSGVRRLTFGGDNYGPSYSPGGGRLVFSHIANKASIAIMRNDGSDRHKIARGGLAGWTPSGEVAFTPYGDLDGLWIMRAGGSHKHLVLRNGGNPVYAPDGTKFLFTRIDRFGDQHVRLADADGRNVRQPPCRRAFGLRRTPVSYSADGRWLLVSTQADETHFTLARLSLGSCRGKRVVGRTTGDADWQSVPAPE